MGRPFTDVQHHIDTLIHNHNMLVCPGDRVIMVGDVCYQKAPEYLHYIERFNGVKTLLRGNHDKVFTSEQLYPYFENIYPEGMGFYQKVGDIPCYITHYPTEGVKDAFNLVGHIHAAWKYQLNMLNIGVDVHHFRPVDLETIPFHFKAITDYYDNDVWVGTMISMLSLRENEESRILIFALDIL